MNDLRHPYRVQPYRDPVPAGLLDEWQALDAPSAAEVLFVQHTYGRGVLRAIPKRCFLSAERCRVAFGGLQAWSDERFGVWVVRCYHPASRYWRRIITRPVETLRQ